MSGIVGSRLNNRGSGLIGSLGTDGQVLTSSGAGAGAVFEAGAIDDNAVTLAKMAGLARGNLIYGDASGDPAALAVGSAAEVLTHDGTDFDWAAAAGGGAGSPYFHMKTTTTNQDITEDVWTKVALATSVLDSDGSAVDTTNYKYTIPTGEGGKWFIGGQVSYYFGNNDLGATYFMITGTTEILQCLPYVAYADNDTRHCSYAFQGIFNFSASNTIELHVYMQAHGGVGPCALHTNLTNSNNMYGFKIAS